MNVFMKLCTRRHFIKQEYVDILGLSSFIYFSIKPYVVGTAIDICFFFNTRVTRIGLNIICRDIKYVNLALGPWDLLRRNIL